MLKSGEKYNLKNESCSCRKICFYFPGWRGLLIQIYAYRVFILQGSLCRISALFCLVKQEYLKSGISNINLSLAVTPVLQINSFVNRAVLKPFL
jgi:hypothetical protein